MIPTTTTADISEQNIPAERMTGLVSKCDSDFDVVIIKDELNHLINRNDGSFGSLLNLRNIIFTPTLPKVLVHALYALEIVKSIIRNKKKYEANQ